MFFLVFSIKYVLRRKIVSNHGPNYKRRCFAEFSYFRFTERSNGGAKRARRMTTNAKHESTI